jgi:cellulose synthase/poly-beta-1,6-N-acetylglucosamine synthase-like glycosyltransferase/peptidoglycan/xylan/chitin deacetylase (PgdA/CDA1 family)
MSRRGREAREPRSALALARRLRNPPAHWWLLGLCFAAVLVLIVFQGICTHTLGASRETHRPFAGRAPLAGSEPLLSADGAALRSPQPPPGRRIALTFDDGPDPRWTPKVLAVLRAQHVPATFFMIGSQAARRPDLVRLVARAGGEIGNHTFTHADLGALPAWQRRAQIDFTEAVLAGVTGRYPRFIRPPYSATPDAVTPRDERVLAQLIGSRYLLALADYDSRDWTRPGVRRILANATPPHRGRGGVIMLHDGGGNRAETVAALRLLIPRLRREGYTFVPLRALLGLTAAEAEPRAPAWQRTRAVTFLSAVRLAFWVTRALGVAIALLGALIALRALIVLLLAGVQVRRKRRRPTEPYAPAVAVVVPAFNEAVGIEKAVRSLAASRYPGVEVIVIDDGSTDGTGTLVERLGLDGVRVIRRPNGGKAAALNTGVAATGGEVVVMVDGDTVFEPETIARLVRPLADPRVAAVAGNTKVGNRSGLLGRWQHIEYVMGFNLDRRMYEVLQSTPTVPGAIGAFRRDVLVQVGGVSGQTLAEDTDLTLAIGRHGFRVVYAEDALAWTEAPSTLSGLWRQRYRWSFGTVQAVWKHKAALLARDPRERRVGHRALPYLTLFQVLLPLGAPLIDLYAVYGIVFTDPGRVIGFWLAFNALQLVVALVAFRLDGEPLRPLWALPLQQFVYRQLMYVVIIESVISALVGARATWRHIPRTGDVELPELAELSLTPEPVLVPAPGPTPVPEQAPPG